jgi:predicted RNA binding protein YcfA (HicA-like mRNA interferase family)
MRCYTTKQIIDIFNSFGWKEVRAKGSHRIFAHNKVGRLITIPYRSSGADICLPMARRLIKEATMASM